MTYTALSRYQLPFPPSVNGYWRAVNGRQIISKRGREYRTAVLAYLSERTYTKHQGPLIVTIDLFPPDHRRRDVDNYSKAILDALTHAEVWEDDSQIIKLTVSKQAPDGEGCAFIEILEVAE